MSLSNIANNAVLSAPEQTHELPPLIPGSELQLDGDISAYYYSWLDETLAQNIEALKQNIEVRRLMAGCEKVNVYTTQGLKGGREKIAQVQEYQKTRSATKDPEKQERVNQLRQFMQEYTTSTVVARPQFHIEADDAMSIRQRECIAEGKVSIIMTKDKDLNMVPGTHIDFDDYTFFEVPDGYGNLFVKGEGDKKKVLGYGTSQFWLQMLMGDSADHIPGLPLLATELVNRYNPTKPVAKAMETLRSASSTDKQKKSAKATLAKRKAAKVGQILAMQILTGCKTDREAYLRVVEAYRYHYGVRPFRMETWRGETIETTAGAIFLEQARLLWMHRYEGDDVLEFIKERCGE